MPKVTRQAVEKMAPMLMREIPAARRDFRYYKPYLWDTHVPLVKSWCQKVVTSYVKQVSPKLRLAATEFLVTYGPPQGGPAKADETMVMRSTVRWTANMMDTLAEAARKRGVDVAEFVRVAAMEAARLEVGEV